MTQDMKGRLIYPGEIRKYVLGGNSTFTIQDKRTAWATLKVKSGKLNRNVNWSTGNQDKSIYFVSRLVGTDNESDYFYIGFLKKDTDGAFRFHAKNGVSKAYTHVFERFWDLLESGCRVDPRVEIWHEGQCCMCGRKLTVPESVAAGIGPECAGKE